MQNWSLWTSPQVVEGRARVYIRCRADADEMNSNEVKNTCSTSFNLYLIGESWNLKHRAVRCLDDLGHERPEVALAFQRLLHGLLRHLQACLHLLPAGRRGLAPQPAVRVLFKAGSKVSPGAVWTM